VQRDDSSGDIGGFLLCDLVSLMKDREQTNGIAEPVQIIHYDDLAPAGIIVGSSSLRGGASYVEVPHFEGEIRPYADVARAIEICEHAEGSRGITAVLRITYEQISNRVHYRDKLSPLYVFLANSIAVGLVGFFAIHSIKAIFVSIGMTLFFLYLYRTILMELKTLLLHRREVTAIEIIARKTIEQIVARGQLPRKLYGEDLKMLRRLSRKNKPFSETAKRIIDSARAS